MVSIQSEEDFDKDVLDSRLDSEKAPLLSASDAASDSEKYEYGDSVPELTKQQNRRRWLSIYVMYFTMFLSAVTFSIVLSSLWPYLLQIYYAHATTQFLGWVVASYSFGQLVASPFFGVWADWRPTREPLIVSLIINIVFNLLYSYAGAFSEDISGTIMLISRAFVGFGAGNAAVVRSYVSEATTERERTGAMAGISGSQAIGFILGPALGLAFAPLGSRGLHYETIKLDLNMYTGPGYLGALLGVANILLLIIVFKEYKLFPQKKKKQGKQMKKVFGDSVASVVLGFGRFDRLAAFVTITLFFSILFVFSVFETIITPLSMDEFAWTKKQALVYNNICFAVLAVIAITTFIAIKFITKKVDERVVFMLGMFLMAFGNYILIPMGNEHPSVTASLFGNDTSAESVGCRDPPQSWCTHDPKLFFFQYVLALVLMAVGYPAASVLCYSIYSKILGPFRQGAMMGWLTAAGSLARSLGPLFVSFLYHATGPTVTFSVVVGIVGASILLLLIFCRRLIPYHGGGVR